MNDLRKIEIKNNADIWDRELSLSIAEIKQVGLHFTDNGTATGNVCIAE